MSVKIRLSRHGKKNYAFFHILATDVRAPRDSRFIELLGSYDPNTNPATIVLNVDRAVYWLQNGAQPTITARRIRNSILASIASTAFLYCRMPLKESYILAAAVSTPVCRTTQRFLRKAQKEKAKKSFENNRQRHVFHV